MTPTPLKIIYTAMLGLLLMVGAYAIVVRPGSGRGPGAVAAASVRENPASWRAVYVPYVVSSGSGSGGYSFGK